MKTKNLRSIFIIALMAVAFTFYPGIFPSGNIALAHTESEKAEANASKPVSVPSPGKLDLVEPGENSLIANIRQLTFSGAKAGEGYFSRDGRQMIFQSDRDPSNPFYQIYLMDLASGKTRRLSPGHGKTTCSWLHPSSKKALFSSTHLDPDTKKKEEQEIANRNSPTKQKYSWNYDEHYDIFEVDLKNPAKLKRLTDAVGYDAEASYSPNGKYIAFASNRSAYSAPMSDEDKAHFTQDAAYMMDIYIMKADGSDVRQLTTAKGYDGGPFFSADGKKITWRRFTPDEP
jgi:Tol biopolymer transport system component